MPRILDWLPCPSGRCLAQVRHQPGSGLDAENPGLEAAGKTEAQAAGKPPDSKRKNHLERTLFYRVTFAMADPFTPQ